MKTDFKTINDFKESLISSKQLQDAFKADPVEAAKDITDLSPLQTDAWIYRIVVTCLGLTIWQLLLV